MLLGCLFFLVAVFYASIGFGGGSSYIALLALWEVPFAAIPVIALLCNIIVVSGNSFHYARAGYLDKRLLLPLVLASIPMAYIGGRLPIGKEMFLLLLFISLTLSGLRLLIQHRQYGETSQRYRQLPLWLGGSIGAALGLLAGITGIGGGIFLAPVLYQLRAGSPKHIATASSVFILLNSLSGLAGQFQKSGLSPVILDYWYLPLLALMGGQIGNRMTLKWIPPRTVALLTALLILFVAGRLGWQMIQANIPSG